MEIKLIPGYEKEYAISIDDVVYRLLNRRNGICKPYETPLPIKTRKDAKGYSCVSLCRNGKVSTMRISRMVLLAFVGSPASDLYQAAHLDVDKDNNHVSNLKWALREENASHKKLHGTEAYGQKNGSAKLSDEQVIELRKKIVDGHSRKQLAIDYNVSKSCIDLIANGRSRKKSEIHFKGLYLEALARETKLRNELEKIACLGNGNTHGNSTGNCMAIDALAQPHDDSALREMIAGVYDECAKLSDSYAYMSQGFVALSEELRAQGRESKGEMMELTEKLGWLADKIPAFGGYGKDCANTMRRAADEITKLRAELAAAAK